MIQGYPASTSVAPGQELVLHVSTTSSRFRMAFYQWRGEFVPMEKSDWLPGQYAAPCPAEEDWHWPAYGFAIPDRWPSAVYIVHFEEAGGAAPMLAMTSAAALFVVRGEGRSRLLYKLPFATYHAYNCTGGACFYVNPPRSADPPGAILSFHRPGGGIGGETWGAADYYDPSSPRQTFAHWDAGFIGWLLRHGYEPEFCSDLDIHRDPALLDRYRLMLSVGHDEYWSEATRDHVEGFIGRGGNVAFFGANLCWWRIHIIRDGTAMVCHQGGPKGAFDHWWPPTGVKRPEDALTGMSYRHGGGWWDGPRDSDGYIVQDPKHWVFAGTGLRRGDAFGSDTLPPLIGYECDGAPLEAFAPATGIATLSRQAGAAGTPESFRLLAAARLSDGWQERPPRETHCANEGIHAATMGVYQRNGTVFNAGTVDWAQVLASGQSVAVETITRNVVERLSA